MHLSWKGKDTAVALLPDQRGGGWEWWWWWGGILKGKTSQKKNEKKNKKKDCTSEKRERNVPSPASALVLRRSSAGSRGSRRTSASLEKLSTMEPRSTTGWLARTFLRNEHKQHNRPHLTCSCFWLACDSVLSQSKRL